MAKASPPADMKYFILLILTDGAITDLSDTIDAIVTATAFPLSIVIVGVGSHDFKDMVMLDGDDGVLRSGAQQAKRDIVQFVPFRKPGRTPENLAEEVLAEIPSQLLEFMNKNNVKPKGV